ncbi:uncharacterized protein si:ch211-153b23.4 isoform X1 [Boleophthalmus pectinirostris]|uniref:uncharacterized protein si:ch211-153b23.4 isoform X1 n=1 Tax=Boleophthalmus pectinirostris TaxID=150288 RepID=UPI002432D9B4|nr:uncharacterized protein si:ch211-153b23.4 isoform X1 [Boleophthalmus pectinirostris]
MVSVDELRLVLTPGLGAFSLALFLIGFIAILAKNVVVIIISISISLACAHQIADLFATGFGHTTTAAYYLLVFLVGVYFGVGRLLSIFTRGKWEFPGLDLKDKKVVPKTEEGLKYCDVIIIGLIMNLVSAAVLASPLFGVVLNPIHVCWLWTAAAFHLVMCVFFFRAKDTLTATFFAFMVLLKFVEGYNIIVTGHQPVSPLVSPIVFSVLFTILALFSCSKGLLNGVYQLFFTAYCIAIAAQSSRGAQGVQAAIFIVTSGLILMGLFLMISSSQTHIMHGYFKSLVSRINCVTLKTNDKDQNVPYLGSSKYADAEVLGHASNVLAAFALIDAHVDSVYTPLPWVVVGGGLLQLLCGLVAFSRGKTFESTAFVLLGTMWAFWGLVRFGALYGDVRGFNLAVGIISFLLFNSLVTVAALFLSVGWFVYILTFQLIIISFLLDALGNLPHGYDIGVAIIFGLVSFYFFLAQMFSTTLQWPQIPLGRPIIKLSGVGGGADICPHVPARKATSVQQIADIMKNGGVCGMPTDTVYVLVAACTVLMQ